MQLLCVATPNKYLCEGVDFHPVNQQTKACGCEANGYSVGCYEWYVISVHTLGLAGCERGVAKLRFKEEQESMSWVSWAFPWPVWFVARWKAVFWKKLVPIRRNFLKCSGESLQSDSLALEGEVRIHTTQTSRRGDWWGIWRNSAHYGMKATRKTVIKIMLIKWKLFCVGRKGQCFLTCWPLGSSSLFSFWVHEHLQPHTPEHPQLHLCPAVSPA